MSQPESRTLETFSVGDYVRIGSSVYGNGHRYNVCGCVVQLIEKLPPRPYGSESFFRYRVVRACNREGVKCCLSGDPSRIRGARIAEYADPVQELLNATR